jgi:hypothetical protein
VERAERAGAVRFLHVAPDAGVLDIYQDGRPMVPGISYGELTGYLQPRPELRMLTVYGRRIEGRRSLLLEVGIERPNPRGPSTLVITGTPGELQAVVLDDTFTPPPAGRARLRVANASPDAPPMDVQVPNEPALFRHVAFPEATPYLDVIPRMVDLEFKAEEGSGRNYLLPSHRFVAGTVETLLLHGRFSGTPSLRIMPLTLAVEARRQPS